MRVEDPTPKSIASYARILRSHWIEVDNFTCKQTVAHPPQDTRAARSSCRRSQLALGRVHTLLASAQRDPLRCRARV